ncbi:MAG: 30S ribosome-binding factor RbfA [Acidobacteriaceae bacterium]
MPENRGRQHGMERRAEALRDEIGAILEGELADPRIGLATVGEVVMNPGGKSARVYVQIEGAAEEDMEQTLTGLNAAKGYIRSELTSRLGVRHCPELFFAIDRTNAVGGRIGELLGRVEQRKRKPGAAATPADTADTKRNIKGNR